MKRYTTPTITVTLQGIDLTGCDIYVTYKQGSKLTLTIWDVDYEFDGTDSIISYTLSQEQTAMFKAGSSATIQINWVTPAGKRDATDEKPIASIEENNLKQVLSYGEHSG